MLYEEQKKKAEEEISEERLTTIKNKIKERLKEKEKLESKLKVLIKEITELVVEGKLSNLADYIKIEEEGSHVSLNRNYTITSTGLSINQ